MNLREARKAKGYTQTQLTVLTGVAQQTISAAERGVLIPGARARRAICKALGVSEDIFPAELPYYSEIKADGKDS